MDENYFSFHSVFYGEYGLPSMPNWSSCLKFLPADELDHWPMDDQRRALIQHMNQFSSRDPIKVLKYADYGPVKDWNTYIEYGQMAQGDWLRWTVVRLEMKPFRRPSATSLAIVGRTRSCTTAPNGTK